jgi:hypothetical protein
MSKKQMIEALLEAHQYAIAAGQADDCAMQFLHWSNRVASALAGAQMTEEHELWAEAQRSITFSADDLSFPAQSESMKAILLGILERVEETEFSEELFPMEIIEGKRKYFEKLAIQANGCYQREWYDACAVILRRMIELLIIDCFERNNIAFKIQENGDYYGLGRLIDLFLAETAWHIPRPVKKYLPALKDLKEIGDSAAHGRNITTRIGRNCVPPLKIEDTVTGTVRPTSACSRMPELAVRWGV